MNSKTSTNSKLEALLEIEREGVEHLMYRGINVWPIIRSELQFDVRRSESQKNHQQTTTKYSFFQLLKGKFKAQLKFRNLKKNILNKKWAENDIVLFSDDSKIYYSDVVDGKLYNRHLDPFYDKLVELGKSVTKLHINTLDEIANKKNSSQFLRMDKVINDWIWFDAEFSDSKLSSEIRGVCSSLDVSVQNVVRRAGYIIALSEIFEIILKQIQAKVIGLVCFYSDDSFAIINAAKKMKIKTIEIQHGKQGEKHFCYSHNLKDKQAMTLMPDYFWNWGNNSAQNINEFISKKEDKIKCIIGGNLWLARWKNQSNQDLNLTEDKLYFEKLNGYKKKILIGTQPVGNGLFPDFVLDLINERKDIFWGIRLHPFQNNSLDEIKLKFKNFENIEIVKSTSLPLYLLFDHFDAVITKWSSIALEAITFNVPAIIIDAFGVESFHKEIEAGDIKSALNKYELIDVIDTDTDETGPISKSSYIEFNEENINLMLKEHFG